MESLVYLDNGATSYPKPESVYRFMNDFYRSRGFSPGRSGYDLSVEAGHLVESTRKTMTAFFNGRDASRLVFAANSTDALNLAIFGMVSPGDHVITTALEHNAVLRPLYHLSQDRDLEVSYLPFDAAGRVDPGDVASRIKANTRLVVVNHGSNVLGTVQPAAEIGRICRDNVIPFLVDGSQTAGKLPIDIQKMNIDVLAFTGHKSLMGPTGIGGLYVGDGIHIRHTRAGGTGVASARRRHLADYPFRLEYGTLNILGIAGLHAGVSWIMDRGIEKIHKLEMDLTRRFRDGLSRIQDAVVYCADDLDSHIGVISFNIRGQDPSKVGTLLDGEYNIACRTGLHCAPLAHEHLGTAELGGTVRAGFGPFNTRAQVDYALKAIGQIAAFLNR